MRVGEGRPGAAADNRAVPVIELPARAGILRVVGTRPRNLAAADDAVVAAESSQRYPYAGEGAPTPSIVPEIASVDSGTSTFGKRLASTAQLAMISASVSCRL